MFCVCAFALPIKTCHPMFSLCPGSFGAAEAAVVSTGAVWRDIWIGKPTEGEHLPLAARRDMVECPPPVGLPIQVSCHSPAVNRTATSAPPSEPGQRENIG